MHHWKLGLALLATLSVVTLGGTSAATTCCNGLTTELQSQGTCGGAWTTSTGDCDNHCPCGMIYTYNPCVYKCIEASAATCCITFSDQGFTVIYACRGNPGSTVCTAGTPSLVGPPVESACYAVCIPAGTQCEPQDFKKCDLVNCPPAIAQPPTLGCP